MNKRHQMLIVGAVGFLVWTMHTRAVPSQAQNSAPAFKSDEYLVIGDANRGSGEPQIALNPRNPKNIVITGMASLHRLGDVLPAPRGAASGARGRGAAGDRGAAPDPAANSPGNANSPTGMFYRTKNATVCAVAVTQDGGQTWKVGDLPLLHDQYIRCSDVIAAAGPDGTLYAGGEPLSAPIPIDGKPGQTRRDCWASYVYSTDGGVTWSLRVEMIGSDDIKLGHFAPGLKPDFNGLPTDRPWLEIDQSTGVVYMTTQGASERGSTQRWVRASHDKGKTLGPIYAIDNEDYPGAGGHIAAGNGTLAAVYTASKVPAALNAQCPCLVFETSKDDGKTFDRHVIPNVPAGQGGQGFGLFMAGDSSKPGRFAVMQVINGARQLAVFSTDDSGKTWAGPVIAGETLGASINKPWIAFGAKGDLAVMWRALSSSGWWEVWAEASRDGGKSWSNPLKVSHQASPPPSRERGNFLFGDDLSMIAVDGEAAHIVWADSRAGFLGTWYGRVLLSAFEYH